MPDKTHFYGDEKQRLTAAQDLYARMAEDPDFTAARTRIIAGIQSALGQAFSQGIAARKWTSDLTFKAALMAGQQRNTFWGGLEQWSLADWGNAAAGECGEMCNAIKKYRRIELGMLNKSDNPITHKTAAQAKIKQEVMDTITYLLHVYAEVGGTDPGADFVRVFNAVSDRYQFPVKL